jgi:hypothetical protein
MLGQLSSRSLHDHVDRVLDALARMAVGTWASGKVGVYMSIASKRF